MTTRTRHNLDLPRIAQAIQEYKTSHKTQKQCAAEFGITYKVFSYYYLYGFKKNVKVGGGLIPEDVSYQKKSKQRQNNYDIVLLSNNQQVQPLQQPQIPQQPVIHQPIIQQPIYQQPIVQQPQIIQHAPQAISKPKAEPMRDNAHHHQSGGNHLSHLEDAKNKIINATHIGKSGKKRLDLSGFM